MFKSQVLETALTCGCKACRLVVLTRKNLLRAQRPAGKGISDDMVSVWNQVLAEHRCQNVRFANTSISHRTENIGPRYDPYSRETLYVTRYGVDYAFTMCALAGFQIEVNGVVVFKDFDNGKAFEAKVLEVSGISYMVWHNTYHKIMSRRPEDPFESLYGRNE